jgi:hypothetical protein
MGGYKLFNIIQIINHINSRTTAFNIKCTPKYAENPAFSQKIICLYLRFAEREIFCGGLIEMIPGSRLSLCNLILTQIEGRHVPSITWGTLHPSSPPSITIQPSSFIILPSPFTLHS